MKGGLTTRAKALLGIAVVVLTAATLHRLYWADLPGPVFEFSGPTMASDDSSIAATDSWRTRLRGRSGRAAPRARR